MLINTKYKSVALPLHLSVVEVFDFRELPVLALEKDDIGNKYLSYLIDEIGGVEQRVYLQTSEARLNEILGGNISLHDAFDKAENNYVFVMDYLLDDGEIQNSYIINNSDFIDINPIPENYLFESTYQILEPNVEKQEILLYSTKKQKLLLDLYFQSNNIRFNVKPYVINKILIPVTNIIKVLLDFDSRSEDRYLAYSNFRQSSFGITIEVNYSHDLFLEKESKALDLVIQLLNAKEKSDFEGIIASTKNSKYIKDYSSILKAIIDNNGKLFTAYANFYTNEVTTSLINKEIAEQASLVLNETLQVIEDVEDIIGIFLEINIDAKEPSFKIQIYDENTTIKGKFELSIIEKIKGDLINIGKEKYVFNIKTYYHPETTVKPEEIKRFMLGYKIFDI